MTKATTITDDLRYTAVTVAAANFPAGATPPWAAIEAALDAAAPFLVDAYMIQEAISAATGETTLPCTAGCLPQQVWREADEEPRQYLHLLQERGGLRLKTLRLDVEPSLDEADR